MLDSPGTVQSSSIVIKNAVSCHPAAVPSTKNNSSKVMCVGSLSASPSPKEVSVTSSSVGAKFFYRAAPLEAHSL